MWTPVANMNGRRLQFGVAVLDDKLARGWRKRWTEDFEYTVECYNLKQKLGVWCLLCLHIGMAFGEITADLFMLSCIGLYGIFTFFTWQKISVIAAEPSSSHQHSLMLPVIWAEAEKTSMYMQPAQVKTWIFKNYGVARWTDKPPFDMCVLCWHWMLSNWNAYLKSLAFFKMYIPLFLSRNE